MFFYKYHACPLFIRKKSTMALKKIKTILGQTILTYDDEIIDLKTAISEAVSRGVDFSYVDFYRQDVSGTDFHRANLFSANFREATAMTCNFRETTLNNANFDLAVADESDFYGSSLRMVSFFRTKLDKTNFSYADLGNSNLLEASLYKSTLYGAGLGDAKNIPFIPTWLPVESFIGWVKVIGEEESYIVKIKILKDSKRTRGVGDICRCDKALVLEIQDIEGHRLEIQEIEYIDKHSVLVFKVGEITECEEWYPGRWNDCKAGITFFIDRQSAVLFE